VPQWVADIPELADLEFMLRTAKSAGDWSEWYEIHMQPDWMLPDDRDVVGEMITVPASDSTHQYMQFSVSLGRYQGLAAPILRELRLTFIDSTLGPTVDEMIAQQAALDNANDTARADDTVSSPSSYPRPTVISRQVWCTDPDCDYSAGLQYRPATHMVIHHTVSSNSSSDWAAVVRAIWSFHTYTRGWGDVGYNYLIDMNGVIYEGHNNADFQNLDVIGTHAAIANEGGMGTALIGTFATPDEYPVSTVPPQPMLDSAAELMAWKADQRNIDVYGASRMVNTIWGLPHLMGHRDVYGGPATTCPGGHAYNLLPWLRDRVASLIGFASPHIYVDELSAAFTKSVANWYVGPKGCGNNGHSYYTWSITDPSQSTNWGEWRPDLPASGRYEIEVYAPYCDTSSSDTEGATYQISHASGVDTVVVSHDDNIGLWMTLGEFDLTADNSTVVRLTDLTSTDSWKGVWFDAIRLRQLPPTAANVQPADNAWLNQRQTQFAWTIVSPSSAQGTGLQVASDAAFSNVVLERSWPGAMSDYPHTFGQDYPNLYWRVLLTTTFNTQVTSVPTRLGIDTAPPVSAINKIHRYSRTGQYELFWGGNDSVSGVDSYFIEVRADNQTNWTPLLTDTAVSTAFFTPPDPNQVYWFRSQATDVAGNSESPHAGNGDLSTDQAILITEPFVSNQLPQSGVWLTDPQITFNWFMTDTADVQTTTFRLATDAGFANPITTISWPGVVTSHTQTLPQDYADLYWQIHLNTYFGNETTSAPTPFSLDTTPPTSAVTAANNHIMAGNYELFWQGSDNLSGISGYHIEFRADGAGGWTRMLTNTTLNSTVFTPPDSGQKYWFRSQAVDSLGNLETPHGGNGDFNTDQATITFNPKAHNQAPTSNIWLSDPTVSFNWTLTEITDVQTTTLTVATDSGFGNVVFTQQIFGNVNSYTGVLSQESAALYWQVTVQFNPPKPGLTDTVTSIPAVFGLDMSAPTSAVTKILKPQNGYLILWGGSDAYSGVIAYNIDYRFDGQTNWTRWITNTTFTSGFFVPPNPGGKYWFRSQAIDLAGNIEPPQTGGDLSTDQAILLPYAIMLPVVAK
jgi:hypothetical protein